MKYLLKKLYWTLNLNEDVLVLAGYLATDAFPYLLVEVEESFLPPLFPSIQASSQKLDNSGALWATLNMLGRCSRWTALSNYFDHQQVFEVS
jgi:hypothetical protein